MTTSPTIAERQTLATGWDPARALSLSADAYTDPRCFDVETKAVFSQTGQWVCHHERPK